MADYPRLLKLDNDTKDDLANFLDEELQNHRAERQDYLDDIIQFQTDYWAKPSVTTRTFPFKGASNLIVPLTAITFEAVHARTMTKIYGINQLTTVEVKAKDCPRESGVAFERFMDYMLGPNVMKTRKAINDIATEQEKFGTGIGKSGYEKVVKTAVMTLGDEEQEIDVVKKSAPTLDAVAGSRFLMRFSDQDPQTALWCGEEHSWSPFEVQTAVDSTLFYEDTMKELEAWVIRTNLNEPSGEGQRATSNQEELENRDPIFPSRIDFVEIWLAWDIDSKAPEGFEHVNLAPRMKELQVFYHPESRTVMGARYNYNKDLSRPYRTGPYIPLEHRWNGIGICKQAKPFQQEITTMHRQRLDNATLANMRMFKVHRLSGYGPKEPVFPGKMWFLDDMDHIESFQMGEVYSSSFGNEQAAVLYHQQHSGVNEMTLGMPSVGTPGTATGDLARIQEGNKKHDFTYSNLKILIDELIMDTAVNIKQFGTQSLDYFTIVDGGELVLHLLSYPIEQIRSGLVFKIGLVGQSENRLSSRNDWTQIAGLLQQYFTGSLQIAQMLGDQQLSTYIGQKALVAGTEAMRQILETYDRRNIDRIVLSELEAILNQGQDQQGGNIGNALSQGSSRGAVSGGNQRAGGVDETQGMAALQKIIEVLGTGS